MIYQRQPTWNQRDSEHEIEASDQIPHPYEWRSNFLPLGQKASNARGMPRGGGGCLIFDLTGTSDFDDG